MSFEEKKVGSKVIYDGRILRLEVDDVELPDGTFSKRECVRHSGGAAVLFAHEGRIALVKQFRYLYGEEIYEIPAGKLEYGEDAQSAALRELREETGWQAASLNHLIDIYPTPGYTDEVIHIYFADRADYAGQSLDDGEFLNFEFVPEDEVRRMIDCGKIKDAKTVCAYFAYSALKDRRRQQR